MSVLIATRRRAAWLLVVAVLLGSVGAYGFFNRVQAYEASLDEMVEVWTAAVEIPAYTLITAEMLRSTPAPKRYLPAGSIMTEEAIFSQVSAVHLKPGDLITSAVLRSPDLGEMRSITVSDQGRNNVFIDATIQVGDRVDVLVAYRDKDEDVARYLLTGVQVIQVGERPERSISLLVTGEAARELVWMENFGRQIRVVRQG